MNYQDILTQTWEIVKKHRTLWWLGMFAIFTENGITLFQGRAGAPHSISPTPSPSVNPGVPVAFEKAGRVLGSQTVRSVTDWAGAHLGLLAILAVLGLIVAIIIAYCSYAARAGLITSVSHIDTNHKELGFGEAFKKGQVFAGRLFRFDLYIVLLSIVIMIAFFLAIFSALFSSLAMSDTVAVILFGLVVFVAVVMLVVVSFIVSMLRIYGSRMIVLGNKQPLEAWKEAYELFKRSKKETFWALATLFIVSLVAFILLAVIGVSIFAAIVSLFFVLIQNIPMSALIAIGTVLIFLSVLLTWFAGGVVTAFTSTYWTLVYHRLTA